MNTNSSISYQGLLNRNIGTNFTCENMTSTNITVVNLSVEHIIGILTSVLNTDILNPELTFSFNAVTNTFTIELMNNSIPLSRLLSTIYSSTATPSTLVFRDATNSTTMSNLTVSGLLTATANPLSVVSHSNEVYVQSDNGNQEFYITGTPTVGTSNYYSLHGDNSGNISFNPNTHRLTTGFLRCTDTALSTMAGGLTVTGDLTAISAGSVVTNSNAVLTYNTTTGTYYLPLVTTTGTGYKNLSANLNMNYNAATATLTTSIGSFTTSLSSATGTFATGFITAGTYSGGTIGTSTPSLYLGGVTGNKQGMIRFHSGTTAFTTYAGTDTSGNFYIDPTDGKNLNLCTKPVASSCNLNIGASALPSTITIYGNTNQTGIITGSTGNFLLGDWNTDTPSLSLGSTNGTNEGVLELISNATQSFLLESTPTGGFEIYLKTSGTSVALFQLNSTYYNIYTNINLNTGNMYKINNVNLNTDHIQESGTPTNLYFTNLRARTALVPTDTAEIDHTYSTATGVLTSDIKALSIANTKLTNSSISLNGTSMSLGGTYTISATGSITLGSTLMNLGSTYTTIAGMSSLTSTGLTASGGAANPTTFTSATPSITAGVASTNSGVIKIFDATTANFSLIQQSGSSLHIDTSATAGFINIGVNNQLQNVLIGNSTKGVSLYGTILLGSSVIFSSLSMSSLKYSSGGIDIPYNNVKMARLSGSGTSNLITPNWQRVQNTAGSSVLEVQIYTPSASGTFKVEGQITTLYNSTNDRTNFNVAAFKNSASSATQANLTNMLTGDTFVSRNIGTVGAVFTIPFVTFFSYTGCTAGDYFTITAYYQSGTSFAAGSTVGRTASDIPTVLIATQIS